jgi:hypothetical protein
MHRSNTFSRRVLTVGASALASAAIFTGGAFAQDATSEAEQGGPSEGYAVMVHQGTCADYNEESVFDLGEAVSFGVSTENEDQEVTTIGTEGGVTSNLFGVSGSIDMGLEDIGNDGHVIIVHAEDEPVACGQIAGIVNDGELAMAITPVEGSSVVGVALLNDDDGSTNAKVYLFDNSDAEQTPDISSTPETSATPMG